MDATSVPSLSRPRFRLTETESVTVVENDMTTIVETTSTRTVTITEGGSTEESIWDEDDMRIAAAAVCCSKDYELHQFVHLPDYLRHNPHITHGYRVNLTLKQTTFSLFHWHNETLNVWTHLGGLLLFVILALASYTTWLNRAVFGELFSSTVFFLSAMMMLLFSSIFHLYSCCSSGHYDFTAKLDYSGIAILIVGSYYPLLYYIYYCPDQYIWRYGYGAIITSFGIAALYFIWKGLMHQPGTEGLRLFIFLGMGLFGIIPLPQSIVRQFTLHRSFTLLSTHEKTHPKFFAARKFHL